MNKKKGIVLAFGVFDGLHKGHEYFLKEAKKLGSSLVIALAQDVVVKRLKGEFPENGFQKRKRALLALEEVDKVVEGDKEIEKWSVLKEVRPEAIVLGYDQKALQKSLKRVAKNKAFQGFSVVLIKPYKPKVFHSSLLKNVDK